MTLMDIQGEIERGDQATEYMNDESRRQIIESIIIWK